MLDEDKKRKPKTEGTEKEQLLQPRGMSLINCMPLATVMEIEEKGNYTGAQATGNGFPAKTAASAASME
jgi:hypothetical protein